jgi:hypothetical protein
MSKKTFFFISFILVLTMGSGALAQDANHLCIWTDAGADSNLWSDANNWYTVDWNDVDDTWVKSSANSVPAADDVALIGRGADWFPYPNDVNNLGPIGQCVLDSDAVCYQLYIGADAGNANQASHLEMTGGSLTVRVSSDDWVGCAIGWNGTGSMTVHDGIVDIGPIGWEGGNLNIGGYDTGEGTLTMLGGEVYCYHYDGSDGDVSEGHLNMYGGTFYTTADVDWTEFWMGFEDTSLDSTCDVTEGKVIIKSNELDAINRWIDEGKITVAGGDDPNADLFVDYDIVNPGCTTLQAFAPEPGQAYHPNPIFGWRVGLDNPTLTWTPGDGAVSHIVYFSDSFDDVSNGTAPNTPTGVASYSAGILDWDTTYYWRVDEVGISETVEGAVWSFKADTHLNIDDMESYDMGDNPIDYKDETTGTWKDYWTNGTRSEVFIETDIVYDGSSSMWFAYNNKVSPRYAEIEADISDLEIGSDWTVAGAKSVLLHFYGQGDNYGEPMYFGVEDSRGAESYAGVYYNDGDINAIQVEQWQEFNIDLEDLNSAGVHLNDIQKVYIGIGIRGGAAATGSGDVYFDEIEVWAPRCRPDVTFTEGDLSGDCYINNYDLEMVGRDWLLKSDWVSASEPPTGPVAHWRFDEGTGTVATNIGSLGTDFNGELEWMDAGNWITPGAPVSDNPDPNYALYFSGADDYVNVPDFNSVPGGFTTDSATLTAWVKRDGDQVNFAGIVICTRYGNNWNESVIIAGLSVGADWDEPVSTNMMKYHWEEDVGWDIPTNLLIPDNQWTFCAVSVRPTNASVYMMPLGGAMQSTVVDQEHVETTFDQPINIGQDRRDFDDEPRRWKGWIDDVQIYDYALTDEEIAYAAQGSEGLFWKELEPWRADIHVDDIIDFKDYAVMADNWLDGPMLWP